MVSQAQVRSVALGLPGAIEQDHHGRPSFRVAGRIFATLWDPHHLNAMLDEPGILTAVQGHPKVCAGFWWGKRLRAVQVDLEQADLEIVDDLLTDAWQLKAPSALLKDRTAAPGDSAT